MVNQAMVRLTCDFHTHLNVGLYSGTDRPTPPGQIQLHVSPEAVWPGSTLEVAMTVKNTLPTPISQVVVTDLFPTGLQIEAVTVSTGAVEVLDGRMLTVMMGDLPSGAAERIAVTLRADADLVSGTELANVATLFYAESVADQDAVQIEIGRTFDSEEELSIMSGQNEPDGELDEEMPRFLPTTGSAMQPDLGILLLVVFGILVRGLYVASKPRF